MNELVKTQRISIAVLIIGCLLLIGIMVKKAPKTPFTITAQEMLVNLQDFEHVTKSQALKWQENTDEFVFVDLRSPYDFEVKHVKNAINIPTAFLLDDENISRFEEYFKSGKTVVLYGQTERESISPWMLLYEIGISNTKVLLGGFDCYANPNSDCPAEIARYDYAKISKQGGIKEIEVAKEKPKAPVQKKKEIPVKKKAKVQEEGGC